MGALIESFGDSVIDAWTKVTGNSRSYCATVWDVMRYVDGADHDWVEEVVQDLNLRPGFGPGCGNGGNLYKPKP